MPGAIVTPIVLAILPCAVLTEQQGNSTQTNLATPQAVSGIKGSTLTEIPSGIPLAALATVELTPIPISLETQLGELVILE